VPAKRLAIVGTGLIGASIGLDARATGALVTGWDPDPDSLSLAAERGAVEPAGSLAEAVEGVDLAFVAAPVSVLGGQVAAVLAATGEETTVSDTGSTKTSVVAAAGGSPRFVGGHPIAGKEVHGAEHASSGLFEGATWFLTPTRETSPERYALVHGFVGDLGAFPHAIEPAAHDELVALTSHVPHVLANVVVNQAGATRVEGHEPLANAGGSLRDMTRIAGANPRMWVDVFIDNADAVRAGLVEHRRRIEEIEAALARRDGDFIAGWIGEAANNRRRMLDVAYGDAGALQRVQVHVADRPNVLAEILQAFGAARIDIRDFELDHVSAEQGGTLTLIVSGEDEAHRIQGVLEGQGYGVVVSPVVELDEG
jgi:prephenate dehydrogenase